MTYLLPTTPIATEAEALKAARASAISIIIGVVVGVISLVWLLMNPQTFQAAVAQAGAESPEAANAAAIGAQAGLWIGGLMVVVQIVFAFFQWRSPNKVIAIIFILLVIYGLLSTAATPMLASSVPNMPVVPAWQIALSLVILVVQLVLHFTGLRGIGKLDKIQMDAAR